MQGSTFTRRLRGAPGALLATVAMVAALELPAVATATAAAPARAELDVSMGGEFNDDVNYATAGNEEAKLGQLRYVGGGKVARGGSQSVVLKGGRTGLHYTVSEGFPLGNATLDKSFHAEVKFSSPQAQSNLATLLSVGGNLAVRVQGGKLHYGFSSHNSNWANHVHEMPFSNSDKQQVLQVSYEKQDTGAKMRVWLNGKEGPAVVTTDALPANDAAASRLVGFGNEVNSGARERGWNGSIYAVRMVEPSLGWRYAQHDEPMIRTAFRGSFNDHAYEKTESEVLDGTLTSRGELAVSAGSVALAGGQQGLQYESQHLTLGESDVTQPLVAETRFTLKGEQPDQATIIAIGGNMFVRVSGGHLQYGLASRNNGQWTNFYKDGPTINAGHEHSVSVGYVPTDSSAKMTVYFDGHALEEVNANGPATLARQPHGQVVFGNESHQDGLGRGLVGQISEVRVSKTTAAFTPAEFFLQPEVAAGTPDEQCEVGQIDTSNIIAVSTSDCQALVEAKLSALRPTAAQARYQALGQTAFVHFGPNTFYNQEWGHGTEDPSRVDPADLDTDQWAKTLTDAGVRMAILTVKHHDGFALYDSRYTEHDMGATPGRQDIVKKFTDSARKYGLRVGLYMSPADSYQEAHNLFGNGSQKTRRTIPTLVTNDTRKAAVDSGKLPTFRYDATDYGEYFLNMLYEVLTQYGQIDEVWFDGAQGNTTHHETYDYTAFYDMIHKLQPNAVIAVGGNDARWVGNEHGYARDAEWSPQAVQLDEQGRTRTKPREGTENLGSIDTIMSQVRSGAANNVHWYPAEADAKNRGGWFWHADQNPRPVSELVKMNERSRGRNAIFLLNVPPNDQGRMDQADVEQVLAYRQEMDRRYHSADYALGRPATVTTGGAASRPLSHLTDGNIWTSDVTNSKTPTYQVTLDDIHRLDSVVLGEALLQAGQQVSGFVLEGRNGDSWSKLAEGPVIGQRRNVRFTPTEVDALRLRITSARGPVQLARFEAHMSTSALPNPARAYYVDPDVQTAGDGSEQHPMQSLSQLHEKNLAPGSVIMLKAGKTFTGRLDGFGYGTTEHPITLAQWGEGAAPKLSLDGLDANLTASQVLNKLGLTGAGWHADNNPRLPEIYNYIPQSQLSVVGKSSEQSGSGAAANVLDGSSSTIWHSRWSSDRANPPHTLTISLGKRYANLHSVDYLPRLDSSTNGVAKTVKVYVSDDANQMGEPVLTQTLPNDRTYKRLVFPEAKAGQYIRLEIDGDWGDGFGSAAEINVETTPTTFKHQKQPAQPSEGNSGQQPQPNQGNEQPGDEGQPARPEPVLPGPGESEQPKPIDVPKQPEGTHLVRADAPKPVFTLAHDMDPRSPFAGEIQWMMQQGYSKGWPDGTFRPWQPMHRDAMAAFLYRLAGSPITSLHDQFKDVTPATPFAYEMSWMKETGISAGWRDGTFRPNEPVNRAAMAAFLQRFCTKYPERCAKAVNPAIYKDALMAKFSDVQTNDQFAGAISWLSNARITTGWSDGSFRPNDHISREAIAAFIYRMTHNYWSK